MRFSIKLKLIGAFGLLILLTSFVFGYTYIMLSESRTTTKVVSDIHKPTMVLLKDFDSYVTTSVQLTDVWIGQTIALESSDEKKKLKEFHNEVYPKFKKDVIAQMKLWDSGDSVPIKVADCLKDMEELMKVQKHVMAGLVTFEDYSDMMKIMEFGETGSLVKAEGESLQNKISSILKIVEEKSKLSESKMLDGFAKLINTSTGFAIILVLVAVIVGFLLFVAIVKPVNTVRNVLEEMSEGELPKVDINSSNDEVGDMVEALETLVGGLTKTSYFAKEIGEGNLEAKYEALSQKDVLGNSLLTMRKSLVDAAEEDGRRAIEDEKRNWATQGQAKFGELLRENQNSIEELSDVILSSLVKYTGSNQGSLFILNEEDSKLELMAGYAWDRKKYSEKEVVLGEGLVGRCWQEAESIYMTDIPQNYINITSGLGDANPTSLLIVPMLVEDEVHGVIELASFKEYEPYQIQFVEELAESIAATINSQKVNLRTSALLEESQEMSEQLRAQEEEMRQNMEELQATQEEMERKFEEFEKQRTEEMDNYKEVELTHQKALEEKEEEIKRLLDRISELEA